MAAGTGFASTATVAFQGITVSAATPIQRTHPHTACGAPPTTAVVLDDDPALLQLHASLVFEAIPNACIHADTRPIAPADADLYILDNDFNGQACALTLVRQIRSRNPHARVIVCSSSDSPTLKHELLNAGCDHVVPKAGCALCQLLLQPETPPTTAPSGR